MKHMLVSIVAAGIAAAVVAAQGRPAADLYQEALHLQEVKGDLPAAITLYTSIVERHPNERQIVAKALLQLGSCYEKQGRSEAKQAYERIVRDYADVADVAAQARAFLTSMGAAPVTGPFTVRRLDQALELASPDGRYAVYHTNEGEELGRVYLRDLKTDAERLLVDLDGSVNNMVWSPDSRQLAFNFQNVQKKVREVRTVTAATGEMRTLPARDYPGMWSASGDLYLFRLNYPANTIEYLTVPATGGEPRQFLSWSLAGGDYPVPTPDGKSLISAKAKRLLLIDVATRAERPITTGSAEEGRPILVSADGRLVAFASNPEGKWGLYVAPLDRIPVRDPLRLGDIDPTAFARAAGQRQSWWLRNGELSLVSANRTGDVFRVQMDRATGRAMAAPQRLTQDAPWNTGGVVSPDGRHIAYWYFRGPKSGFAVMDADGLNERPLVDQSGVLPLGWRGPHEILFYDFATAGGQKPAITVYDLSTGTQKPLAQVAGLYWKYVPARLEILHSHPGGGGPRAGLVLQARSLADGTDREVATIDNLVPWIAVSADGGSIAYAVTTSGETSRAECEVALMTIEGKRDRVLVPMQRPCLIPNAWSPDGRFLLLTAITEGPRVMEVETGRSWPLHAGAKTDFQDPTWPRWEANSWSPDGSFVVLTYSRRRVERIAWEGVTYEAVTRVMKSKSGS